MKCANCNAEEIVAIIVDEDPHGLARIALQINGKAGANIQRSPKPFIFAKLKGIVLEPLTWLCRLVQMQRVDRHRPPEHQ